LENKQSALISQLNLTNWCPLLVNQTQDTSDVSNQTVTLVMKNLILKIPTDNLNVLVC